MVVSVYGPNIDPNKKRGSLLEGLLGFNLLRALSPGSGPPSAAVADSSRARGPLELGTATGPVVRGSIYVYM